jgi:hypothetical protein
MKFMAYMTNIFAMNLLSSNTIMDELNKIATPKIAWFKMPMVAHISIAQKNLDNQPHTWFTFV